MDVAAEQETYDVVVVGAGAVGENVADRAGRTGLSVVVVEEALVGGECSYWACMPSKALLRPGAVLAAARAVPGAAPSVTGSPDPAATFASRDAVTSHWDDAGQVQWLDGAHIALLRGRARLTGPRTLSVQRPDGTTTTLSARCAVVLVTGSTPVLPPVDGLAGARPWTSREATSATAVPSSLAIIGGGVVACEMATAFTDLGSEVTLLVRGSRLLAGTEPFAGEAVRRSLAASGVDVRLSIEATRVVRSDDGVELALSDGTRLTCEEVLVAAGRRAATEDLGLETVGLDPAAALVVDDTLAVHGVDGGWLFAAGDVAGRVATTHQGKYEARVVGDVIAARFGAESANSSGGGADHVAVGAARVPSRSEEERGGAWSRYRATADHEAVPQVVFTRPEVATVGLTEDAARRAGHAVRTVRYDMAAVAGAVVHADGYEGTAQLVLDVDRGVVLGATFVGPDVGEMLHAATVAVVGQVPLDRLWHAVPAYPTVSEVWLRLLEAAGL